MCSEHSISIAIGAPLYNSIDPYLCYSCEHKLKSSVTKSAQSPMHIFSLNSASTIHDFHNNSRLARYLQCKYSTCFFLVVGSFQVGEHKAQRMVLCVLLKGAPLRSAYDYKAGKKLYQLCPIFQCKAPVIRKIIQYQGKVHLQNQALPICHTNSQERKRSARGGEEERKSKLQI